MVLSVLFVADKEGVRRYHAALPRAMYGNDELHRETCSCPSNKQPNRGFCPATRRVELWNHCPRLRREAVHSEELVHLMQEELCLKWILELPLPRLDAALEELRWLHPQSLDDLLEDEARDLMERCVYEYPRTVCVSCVSFVSNLAAFASRLCISRPALKMYLVMIAQDALTVSLLFFA